MDWGGQALVVLLLILICANVITAAFGYPIYGTFEIATFLTAGVIAFGLSLCGLNQGHISVSFLTDKMPERLRRIVESIDSLFSIFICFIIGYQSWIYAMAAQSKGEVTSALYLPTYPIIYILSVSFIILAFAFIVEFITRAFGKENKAEGAAEDAMLEEILKEAAENRENTSDKEAE